MLFKISYNCIHVYIFSNNDGIKNNYVYLHILIMYFFQAIH